MRSSAEALTALLLLAGCGGGEAPPPALAAAPSHPVDDAPRAVVLPPEAGTPEGPAGTSGMGVKRYDQVGYASWYGEELAGVATAGGGSLAPDAITAAHRTLPLGSYAEVTSLDTGRTIVVLINDRGPQPPDREIDLARGAAALLGMNGQAMAAVRVRSTGVSSADAAALAAGRPAAPRLDAPAGLLAALRRDLQAYKPAVRPAAPVRAPPGAHRYLVQVAAFSDQARARALAKSLDGQVESGGGFHRVRLGPFINAAMAERARDGAARRGYGDATIIVQP